MKEPKDYIGKWFGFAGSTYYVCEGLSNGHFLVNGITQTANTTLNRNGVAMSAKTLERCTELTREQADERLADAFEEMMEAMLGEVGE